MLKNPNHKVTSRLPAHRPLVYLITEGKLTDANFAREHRAVLEIIELAVECGVSMIQIREKLLSARNVINLARDAWQITRAGSAKLLINDRVDIALAIRADGVHLAESSLPVPVVRGFVPDDFIIGCSTHSIDRTRLIATEGADFAVFGPVFSTPGKGEAMGLDLLRQAAVSLPGFPVIALGGIDASNLRAALQTGAAGFAGIRYLNDAANLSRLPSAIVR